MKRAALLGVDTQCIDAVLLRDDEQALIAPLLVVVDDIAHRRTNVADWSAVALRTHPRARGGGRLDEQRLLVTEPADDRPHRHARVRGDLLQRYRFERLGRETRDGRLTNPLE